MVVMKMSTMKAHTRLDLKTSSLIWEYCKVSGEWGGREEEGDDVREGGGERRFQADGEERTPQTHTEAPTQRHATV